MRKIFSSLLILAVLLTLSNCSTDQLTQFKNTYNTVERVLSDTRPTVDALVAQGKISKAAGDAYVKANSLVTLAKPAVNSITSWPPSNAKELFDAISPALPAIEAAIIDPATHPALQLIFTTIKVLLDELLFQLKPPTPPPGTAASPRTPLDTKQALSDLKSQANELRRLAK